MSKEKKEPMLCQHCGYYSGKIARNRVYNIHERPIPIEIGGATVEFYREMSKTSRFLCHDCTALEINCSVNYKPLKITPEMIIYEKEHLKTPPMTPGEVARACRKIIEMLDREDLSLPREQEVLCIK